MSGFIFLKVAIVCLFLMVAVGPGHSKAHNIIINILFYTLTISSIAGVAVTGIK